MLGLVLLLLWLGTLRPKVLLHACVVLLARVRVGRACCPRASCLMRERFAWHPLSGLP